MASVTVNFPHRPRGYSNTVETIEDLRALDPTGTGNLDNILVPNTGWFVWEPESLATDDGAAAVKPDDRTNLEAGRWLVTTLPSEGLIEPLFEALASTSLPEEATTAQTAGWSTPGVGGGGYVQDDDIDPEEFPRSAYINNGRTLRLAERIITPFMFGAQDAQGTHKGADEEAFDCSDALDEMWAFAKRYPDKIIDNSNARGLGITREWTIDSDGGNQAWWNGEFYRIIGGRLIALAPVENMIKLVNKGYNIEGVFELWGGTDEQLNPNLGGGYSSLLAQNGMYVSGAGGSRLGSVRAMGMQRYAVQFDKSFSSTNNNIPITWDFFMGVQCGGGMGDDAADTPHTLGIAGTYSAGTNSGTNNAVTQRSRITLALDSNISPLLVQEDDLIFLNARATEHVITNVVSRSTNSMVVDIFPWVEDATGDFIVVAGGTVSFGGFNMAGSGGNMVYAYGNGVGIQNITQYSPNIQRIILEASAVGIQNGGRSMEAAIEGLSGEHYHFEANFHNIIDVQTAAVGCYLGAPSNSNADENGFLSNCRRLAPAAVTEGEFTRGRQPLAGWTINTRDGVIQTKRGLISNAGQLDPYLGNSPAYRETGPMNLEGKGSGSNQSTFLVLLVDKANAELTADTRTATFGPIYGTGTNRSPEGSIKFKIDDAQSGDATVEGMNATTGSPVIIPPLDVYFTGSISGTTLTVASTAVTPNNPIRPGFKISLNGVAANTFVTAYGTGTGGAGTYTINNSQTVGSTTMLAADPNAGPIVGEVTYEVPDEPYGVGDWKISWSTRRTVTV